MNGTTNTVLPIIDISNPTEETTAELFNASSTLGFVFIEGSRFTQAEVDEMFTLSKSFFAESVEDKNNFAISEDNKGYSSYNQEVLDTSTKRGDPKEAFNFGQFENSSTTQPLPEVFKNAESRIACFSKKCHDTCNKLLDLIGEALKIDESKGGKRFFSIRHDLSEKSGSILRFLYYPAVKTTDDTEDIRAGSHTDYGSMTLLFQRAGQEGLEILSPVTKEWISVPALRAKDSTSCPPIVVNIADQLSFWSADVLKSAVHRVKFPIEAVRSGRDRYSMAYFCHPMDNTLLEPVPSTVIQAHASTTKNKPKDGEILTAGEHLMRRLAATYSWSN
ncbi:hypothetical protein V1511DRAFT_282783 [Dipodascopsis uninucleata]